MGMDLYGPDFENRTSSFHRSWWGWRALWQYCETLLPGISERSGYKDGNYGHVSAEDALALAAAIRDSMDGAATYIRQRRTRIMAAGVLPDDADDPLEARGILNLSHRPMYDFDTEDLLELADFCEKSGGFEFC